MDLDLFCQNMVTDLLSIFAAIGAFAIHALICNDTHGEVVNGHAVVLSAHDFGSHVAGSARRIFGILRIPQTSDTQVCHSQISLLIKHKVLRLDISVKDRIFVQILETQKELQHGNKMKKPVEIVSIYHMIVLAASDLVISLVRA